MRHPEFASFLQKKTEITLDSFETKCPLDEKSIQEIMSKAQHDLLKAERILVKSLGCNHQQYAVLKKEQARVNIIMGNYKAAYKEICSALKKIPHVCHQKPKNEHYLKAEFSLIRSDVERKLDLTSGQRESLKTAESIYRNAFGDNHPMLAFTLQKLSARYFDLGSQKEADKYFEESEKICAVLKRDLQEQLKYCFSDFLIQYNLDNHPILRRQQRLTRQLRRNQGAW